MAAIPLLIGTTANTGETVTYTFDSSIDTTTLQPGQAFDLRSYLYSIGVISSLDITLNLTVIINPNVAVGSSDPTKPTLTLANFKSRDRVSVINNGNIYGAGGYGAGSTALNASGGPGGQGGSALIVSSPINLVNNGNIYGGGGGGGAGAGSVGFYAYGYPYFWNCGGTSPCGYIPSPNCGCWCCYKCKTQQCTYMNQWTGYVNYDGYGGAGGVGQGAYTSAGGGTGDPTGGYGGVGGAGAAFGSYGSTGSYAGYNTGQIPGVGGSPGYYIYGSSNLITFTNNGSLAGLVA